MGRLPVSRPRIRPARAGGARVLAERAALAAVLGYTVVGARNTVRAARWKQQARSGFAARRPRLRPGAAYIYLLVPALREQRVIERTLAHLRSLDYPADRFEIIVAVDHKETGERTTAQVVEEYAKHHPDGAPVSVVSHRGPGQRRSLQLNAALDRIRERVEERRPESRILVGVYDADSRPEAQTLAYIDDQARRDPDATAFQQTVTYLANASELSGRGLLHAMAVYQSLLLRDTPAARLPRPPDAPPRFPPQSATASSSPEGTTGVGGFPRTGPCDGIQIASRCRGRHRHPPGALRRLLRIPRQPPDPGPPAHLLVLRQPPVLPLVQPAPVRPDTLLRC
ncbi:glycosyltransferase [Streptacidiphilus sp. 4-A2]|nr:glycosyltransferase [Streptacidiphilus sp. 4-A2]